MYIYVYIYINVNLYICVYIYIYICIIGELYHLVKLSDPNTKVATRTVTVAILPNRETAPTRRCSDPLRGRFVLSRYSHRQYCMVYDIQRRGRWGGVYCAMVVQ